MRGRWAAQHAQVSQVIERVLPLGPGVGAVHRNDLCQHRDGDMEPANGMGEFTGDRGARGGAQHQPFYQRHRKGAAGGLDKPGDFVERVGF